MLKPSFMSVTYGAGGGTSEYTVSVAKNIKDNCGVDTIAHLTCINSSKDDIHLRLEALKNAGIENILALRGDIPEGMDTSCLEYHYASELVADIKEFGGFCIGGACYPESHPDSQNSKADIDSLKIKVENGCEFLTTQMFFDNNILYNFMYRLYR
jgi:methylenetetrahydrofolate reductase (NADPH)